MERELRDAAEALEARIGELEATLAQAHPADAGPQDVEAMVAALALQRGALERRRLELEATLARETAVLEAQQAARDAAVGWNTSLNDSRATQDETGGAALGCALVALPLLGANALLQREEPWLRSLVAVGVLLAALVVAVRHQWRVGRGQRAAKAKAKRR